MFTYALQNCSAVARILLETLSEGYSDAVQRSPATQRAVLSVLLDNCLPLLAADCSPDTLADFWHPHYALAFHLGPTLAMPV